MPDPGGSGPLTEPGGPLRRLLLALVGLLVLLAYGTAGYMLIEGYSFLDALFMTVITVSTVGFEEVHRLDAAGEGFTISVIVLGVIGFLYTFSMLVELLSSGEWQRHRRVRQVQRRLDGLRDHVIVCGYGRTGRQAVIELTQSGQGFVVVESNPDGLARVAEDRVLHVLGDASSDEILERAGIRRARALISAVNSDERNVYIVLTARSLRPDLYIVARSSLPDSAEKLRGAGADRVVSPYTLSGRRMAELAMQPAVVDTFDLLVGGADTSMRVEELVVGGGAAHPHRRELAGRGRCCSPCGPGRRAAGRPRRRRRAQPGRHRGGDGTREQLTALAAALRPAAARSGRAAWRRSAGAGGPRRRRPWLAATPGTARRSSAYRRDRLHGGSLMADTPDHPAPISRSWYAAHLSHRRRRLVSHRLTARRCGGVAAAVPLQTTSAVPGEPRRSPYRGRRRVGTPDTWTPDGRLHPGGPRSAASRRTRARPTLLIQT